MDQLTDVIDFLKMTSKEKEKFIESVLKRQLNIANSFGRFARWPVDDILFALKKSLMIDFIKNLDVEKIKERLI